MQWTFLYLLALFLHQSKYKIAERLIPIFILSESLKNRWCIWLHSIQKVHTQKPIVIYGINEEYKRKCTLPTSLTFCCAMLISRPAFSDIEKDARGWWVAYVEGKKGETQKRDGRRWGLKRRNEIWNLHWGLLNYNVTWLNRKPLIESALYEGTHIYLIVHIVYCWANIIGCKKRNTFSRLCDFFWRNLPNSYQRIK